MCGKLLADGLLKPGQRAVTCDKAAGAAGAIGAQVTCADPTQLKQVLETGELLLEEPENGALKETVKALNEYPGRDKIKVMVGGAPITQEFADEIGADAYTEDAASAAQVAKKLAS